MLLYLHPSPSHTTDNPCSRPHLPPQKSNWPYPRFSANYTIWVSITIPFFANSILYDKFSYASSSPPSNRTPPHRLHGSINDVSCLNATTSIKRKHFAYMPSPTKLFANPRMITLLASLKKSIVSRHAYMRSCWIYFVATQANYGDNLMILLGEPLLFKLSHVSHGGITFIRSSIQPLPRIPPSIMKTRLQPFSTPSPFQLFRTPLLTSRELV